MFTLGGFVFCAVLKSLFMPTQTYPKHLFVFMAKLDQTFATDCLEMLLCESFSGF